MLWSFINFLFVAPRISPSCSWWVTVDTGGRMFRTEQGFVLLVCGIGVVCAVPASVLITAVPKTTTWSGVKIKGLAYPLESLSLEGGLKGWLLLKQ